MHRRTRGRLLATAIVVAVTSLAHAALKVTENPASTQVAPIGTTQHVLVSIRNTSAAQVSIVSIAKTGTCPADITIAKSGGGLIGATLDPSEQVQYVATAPSGVTANTSCVWDVTLNGPNPKEQFTTTFRTSGMASGAPADAQPSKLEFATTATFEVQDVLLTSYSSTQFDDVSATIVGATADVKFFGTCDGATTCNVGNVPAFGTVPLKLKCQRSAAGTGSGAIEWRRNSGMSVLTSQMWTCAQSGAMGPQIFIIDPAPIAISGPQGQPITRDVGVDSLVAGNGLAGASLAGAANIAFASSFCGTPGCTFMPAMPLPDTVPVVCTPAATPSSATLTVQGTGGSGDTDTATVQCAASAGGPQISVSPPSLTAPDTRVGETSLAQTVGVTNNGTADLTFSIAISGAATEWLVDDCLAPTTCTVPPSTARTIGVQFAPAQHGLRPASLGFDSNAGVRTVTLTGRGLGGVLEVVTPSTNAIDFGVIGRDQEASEPVQLVSSGNIAIEVDIGTPGAPFGVSGIGGSTTIGPNGATAQFAITCRSAMSGGPFDDAVTLTSMDVYRQETSAILVRCAIANTNLQVTPELAFGEIRKGTAAPPIEIVLTNPGPDAVTVEKLALSEMPTGLSLEAAPTPIELAAGESTTGGELVLTTTMETDLAGTDLLVTVDGEALRLPITGQVVTPSAYVAPENLDLGTACVGTQVSGAVMMINTGTATLTMQAPTLEEEFTLVPAPTGYPKELRAGTSEIVTVSPTASRVGVSEGTLEWDVDIETAPFRVPLRLEYIDVGTGISPGSLAFGTIELETRSFVQTVTLENCNPTPVRVTVAGVRRASGDVSAWQVQPDRDERELGPRDKMTVAVAFAPTRPGRHVGYLQLAVDGAPSDVELVGDAVGFYLEPTSFYACGCATSAARPGAVWPIVLAFGIVLRRRRRC